jgi:hypothetical protein
VNRKPHTCDEPAYVNARSALRECLVIGGFAVERIGLLALGKQIVDEPRKIFENPLT